MTRLINNKLRLKNILPIALFISLCPYYAIASTHVLGTFGRTYSIIERDALEEIKEHASKIDWHKHFNKEKAETAVKNYQPENMTALPRATEDRTFSVDMTYTLDFDIPDGKGGILYPKGYTFNPLDYVQLPNILVVIDASDKKQVEWFESSQYINDYKTMCLVTGGKSWALSQKLQKPVFYANKQIVERFKLKAVPSVVQQKGQYMEVKEFDIENQKNSHSVSDNNTSLDTGK
ncbi:MAG: hypothetical protein U9Q84_09355 [Thermodesulfobacteriota bacterium]|nr:hypothetical protein [Thermodesulfobacteriota bacterium]